MRLKAPIAIISLLAILSAFLLIDDIRVRADKHDLVEDVEHQKYLKDLQEDNLNKEITVKNKSLNEFETQLQMLHPYLISDSDLKRLKEQGLGNPIEDLKNSLIENQSLLLTDSLIDGRQRILKEYIVLLIDQRVLAYWETGHSDGVIYTVYDVGDNGRITWKIIDEIN